MARQVRFGTAKGEIFPHQQAAALMTRGRYLVQPPALIARRLQLAPGASVLELGCGPGYFTNAVARRLPQGRYVLFDFQSEMLRMAGQRAEAAGKTAHLVQGDALALPFAGASFDVVFLVAVLGETGDASTCIAEIRRVLRPGGRLSISEIRGDDDFIARGKLLEIVTAHGFEHERSFGIAWNYTENFTLPAA